MQHATEQYYINRIAELEATLRDRDEALKILARGIRRTKDELAELRARTPQNVEYVYSNWSGVPGHVESPMSVQPPVEPSHSGWHNCDDPNHARADVDGKWDI